MKQLSVIILVAFLAGCLGEKCPQPMVEIGEDCCYDVNENGFCDSQESTTSIEEAPSVDNTRANNNLIKLFSQAYNVFYIYSISYSPGEIMKPMPNPQFRLQDMKRAQDNITDFLNQTDHIITELKTDGRVMGETVGLVEDYAGKRRLVESCRDNMAGLRLFARDFQDLITLSQKYVKESDFIRHRLDSERYSDALSGIDEYSNTVQKAAAEFQELERRNVIRLPEQDRQAYNELTGYIDELADGVQLILDNDTAGGKLLISEYMDKDDAARAAAKRILEREYQDTLTEWYRQKISPCPPLFQKYSMMAVEFREDDPLLNA